MPIHATLPRMVKPHAGALIYVRKSTVEVEQRSIEQQEQAGREAAARIGLPVVGVVAEEASAYAERERPKFTAALRRAADERLVIITWAIDRFSRKGAEAVLPLLKADSPLRLVTVEGDDTADERQRLIILIKAEMALQYSQQLGRNVRRAREAARTAGLWAGAEAPYGYRISGSGRNRRLERHETEARVVRELADAVDRGEPFYTLATRLNERGVPSPRGKTWAAIGVKRVLYNPAVAGFHPRHRVDMVRDADGQPVVTHEPILSVDQWERVRAKIEGVRNTTAPGRRPTTLLSGILRCPCGAKMGGNTTSGRKGAWYRCMGARAPGQTHSTIQQGPANKAVVDMVLGRIIWLGTLEPEHPTVRAVAEAWASLTGVSTGDPERLQRQDTLDAARAALERTARREAEGLLDEKTAGKLLAEYRQQVAAADVALSALGPAEVDLTGLLDMPRPKWEALPLERQRAVLLAVTRGVQLRPGRLPPELRLRPLWVEQKEPPA